MLAALTDPVLVVGDDVRATHPDAARSYLADGRGVAWQVEAPAGWVVALDAELADQRVPAIVRRRGGLPPGLSGEAALMAWTQAEVMAKLRDEPILLRLRTQGLGLADLGAYEPIALATHAVQEWGLVVTVGVCRTPRA